MNLILRVIVILAVASNSNAKAVDKHGKRGLYFGLMVACETGRSALDYLDYGCYCGLGGAGTPADQLDSCCFAHDKCYEELLSTKTCNVSFSLYSITYKYNECSNCAKPSEYSWWDQFGYETVECRKGLCECDAIAARCFKASTYNDALKDYDQEKCHM